MSEPRRATKPTGNDQGQGFPPAADGPAKGSPPPERNRAEKPPPPETATDVHGDPETPV